MRLGQERTFAWLKTNADIAHMCPRLTNLDSNEETSEQTVVQS